MFGRPLRDWYLINHLGFVLVWTPSGCGKDSDDVKLQLTIAEIVDKQSEDAISSAYSFYTGQAIPADWLALYTPYLRQHGLEGLRDQIVADHGRHRIPEVYSFYTGQAIPADWLAAYEPYLQQHGLAVLRQQMANDQGGLIADLYRSYTGQELPTDQLQRYKDYLRDYGMQRLLADIEDTYVRDTVLPVLHAVLPLLLGD